MDPKLVLELRGRYGTEGMAALGRVIALAKEMPSGPEAAPAERQTRLALDLARVPLGLVWSWLPSWNRPALHQQFDDASSFFYLSLPGAGHMLATLKWLAEDGRENNRALGQWSADSLPRPASLLTGREAMAASAHTKEPMILYELAMPPFGVGGMCITYPEGTTPDRDFIDVLGSQCQAAWVSNRGLMS